MEGERERARACARVKHRDKALQSDSEGPSWRGRDKEEL